MKLAIWSTTTPREHSTHQELFRRQLEEAELAERIGIDQMWFLDHHLQPSATPSPNLMIAAASQRTRRIRFANMVNILPFRNPLLVAEEAGDARQSDRESPRHGPRARPAPARIRSLRRRPGAIARDVRRVV